MTRNFNRSLRGRRRRALFIAISGVGVLVVASSVTWELNASSGNRLPRAEPTTSALKPSDTSTSHATGSPEVTVVGTYRVGTTNLDITEATSPAGGMSRVLPTVVWYPEHQAGNWSAPDLAHAPYPLLVFSQGYDLSVSAYAGLLEDWASAGFVVAAPTYPDTDPSDPAALDENDIVNHPADLRFVITTLLGDARAPGSVLSGLVNAAEIGLVGHSDGGDVSLAVAANSCCRDARVKAAAILSGAELTAFGGRYFAGNTVPLLVVQGSADTINVPACSAQIYDAARPPKYYLDLVAAMHEPPYTEPGTTDQEVVAKITTEFFDAELAGQSTAIGTILADGDVIGATQITDSASAPPSSGTCPGAPG
ncbi:MAG TPA: hypothetical protein VNG12_10075 [Acidimicrobiales bacterium]|nr:hypothetical protein [Acidimicrobiales bacterium]